MMSGSDIQQYLREKGLLKNGRGYSKSRIRENHLIHLIDARLLEEIDGSFRITSLGNDIRKIISKAKEFNALPIPTHRELYLERILLELRKGRKTYSQLKSKLNIQKPLGIIKRLKDKGFLKVNHPYSSLSINSLSRFTVSSYYWFIKGIRAYIEKTGSSWFTEYSITPYLNHYWTERFGRPIDSEERCQLIEKGIEAGDIRKSKAQWKLYRSIRDPFRRLSSGRKILNLIEEGCDCVLKMAVKSGLCRDSVYKILRRLEKRNLVERDIEYVTIELTGKGKRLADCLSQIKERVEIEVNLNPLNFSGFF
jgi:Mn-dependent DtxR family transcriptional regulator